MNSIEAKAGGCAGLIVTLLGVLLVAVIGINLALGHLTDYKIAQVNADSVVAVAKLDAQAKITVGCEDNSWFTSMAKCIELGGVNGPAGISWGWWIVLVIVAVVIAWVWHKASEVEYE